MRKTGKVRAFLLPLILCAAVIILLSGCEHSVAPGLPSEADIMKTLSFKPYGEGYEITEYSGSFTELIIPSVYKGKPVVRIDDDVFAEKYRLKTVLIPESVIEIGTNAFSGCFSLERLDIRGSAAIGCSAFESCFNLSEVNVDNVVSIGSAAFKGCSDLYDIALPPTLTRIEDNTFDNCLDLAKVNFPDSLTYIGAYAFDSCSLQSVHLGSGELEIDDFAFAYNEITQLDLGGTIRLGNSAFAPSMQLKELILPDQLKAIGSDAFSSCRVHSLHIGSGLEEFDYDAFSGFSEVKNLSISPDNTRLTVNNGVLFSADMTRLLLYPTLDESRTYTVPDGVAEISSGAFSAASNLTSVTLPSSLRLIDDYAFFGCHGLEELIIPEGVSEIGVQSISCCSSLAHVQLPESLRIIRKDAFFYSPSLTEIELPDGVEFLGETCFSGCPITEFHIGAGLREMEANPFSGTPAYSVTVSPDNKYFCVIDRSLCTADGKELIMYPRYSSAETYIIPHSIEIIRGRAFAFCNNLHNIILPEGLKSIGENAFYECSQLDGIIIPESMESIGEYAFGFCNAFRSITIPGGMRSIGKNAFSNCSQLESIIIEEGTESIADNAFSFCASLKSVAIPDSAANLGRDIFSFSDDVTVICSKDSCAWKYCEDNDIPHSEKQHEQHYIP